MNLATIKVGRFTRFVFVGAANTAVAYGVYAFFLFWGLSYPLANFLSLVVGIVLSFKTQGTFVFDNPDNRLFFRFAAFWAIMYVVNIGLIRLFLGWGMNAYAAGALALPLIALLSFLGQDRLVFRRVGNVPGGGE